MPQSLVQNYIHITFSTKGRVHTIDKNIQPKLYAYIIGICKNLECNVIEIGGVEDHIHILCRLSKKIALMKLLEEVKKNSSKWIKTQGIQYVNFYWQIGYGAFSVSGRNLHIVEKYIQRQEEHHRKMTFKEEYRETLVKHEVAFDEKYVWD